MIKIDILKVIVNYVEIEDDGFEIKMFKCRGEYDDKFVFVLVVNILLKNIKDRCM